MWGLGGAGKSQLVLNYIQEYRHNYSAIFWVGAGSKESIERDYVQIYRLLYGRPLGTGQKLYKSRTPCPQLNIGFMREKAMAESIDDDQERLYSELRYFMPDASEVHIIITSRSSMAKKMTPLEAIEAEDMESSEVIELFRRCAKILDLGPNVETEMDHIGKELRCLTLAMTLSGTYVSVTPRFSSDIWGYLPEYRQRRKELLVGDPSSRFTDRWRAC